MRSCCALAVILLPLAQPRAAPPQPAAIAGRVLDAAGEPAPGAEVLLRWRVHPELPGLVGISLGDDGLSMSRHLADDLGRFEIRPPHPGPFLAVAAIEGQRSPQRFPVMAGDALELRLEAAFEIGGCLIAGDQSVADTPILLRPHHGTWSRLASYRFPEPRAATRTDDAGSFRLPLEFGQLQQPHWGILMTVAVTHGEWQTWMHEVVQPVSSARELVVPLRGGLMRGRVLDDAGQPVPGAVVLDPGVLSSAVACGADGSFAIPARTWKTIVALGPGFAPVEIEHDWQTPGGVETRLPRGLRIRAALRDQKGEPVAGARVLWAMPRSADPPIERLGVTGPRGEVEFDSAALGRRLLGFVEIDGVFARFCSHVTSSDADLGVLPVDGDRTVRGEVRNPRRAPIPHARVALWTGGPPFDVPPRITYADRGGRFRFEAVPAGAGFVSVDAGERGWATADVAAADAQPKLTLATTEDHGISGIVIDLDDQPVQGAWVTIFAAATDERDLPGHTPGYRSFCALTGPDGRFALRGLRQRGEWDVSCSYFRDEGLCGGSAGVVKTGDDDVVIVTREQSR